MTLGEVEKLAPSAIWRLDISSHSTRSGFSHSLDPLLPVECGRDVARLIKGNVGLQVAAGFWPTHKDASVWADVMRERAGGKPLAEIIFVEDMTRYGLHLHLGTGTHIEKIALQTLPQSPFDRIYDELLEEELAEHEADAIWICKTEAWERIKSRIEATGADIEVLGPPYQGRMIFRVVRR